MGTVLRDRRHDLGRLLAVEVVRLHLALRHGRGRLGRRRRRVTAGDEQAGGSEEGGQPGEGGRLDEHARSVSRCWRGMKEPPNSTPTPTSTSTSNRSGRSPACWTESTEVYGAKRSELDPELDLDPDPDRFDEVAGPPATRSPIGSGLRRKRAQGASKETSRGTYCDRFGRTGIPSVHPGREREDVVGAEGRDVEPADLLRRPSKSRVVVETCAEAFHVADRRSSWGTRCGWCPRCWCGSLGVGARGVKTDERDARALSEVSTRLDLPSVHVPSHESRKSKSLCGMRDALVGSRTQLINTVRGWMRGQTFKVGIGQDRDFLSSAEAEPRPSGAAAYVARQLAGDRTDDGAHPRSGQGARSDRQEDPTCPSLMSVPGVGPVTAIRFVAALDEIGRFPSVAQVQSYLGLTPAENSSSERQRRTGITKAGPPALRASLVQAAWAARSSSRSAPDARWCSGGREETRQEHRDRCARSKALAILFAIWRDGTFYSPRTTGAGGSDERIAARSPRTRADFLELPLSREGDHASSGQAARAFAERTSYDRLWRPSTASNLCGTDRAYSIATVRSSLRRSRYLQPTDHVLRLLAADGAHFVQNRI